jgi:hypothetical protein
MTVERVLRNPDGREIEMDSDRACDAKQGRMEPAVPVDEQDIRPFPEPTHGLFNPWRFPIREVGGDVGEVHTPPHGRDLDGVKIRERDRDRDRVGLVAQVGEVDSRHEFGRPSKVFLYHPSAEFALLFSPRAEEIDRFQ